MHVTGTTEHDAHWRLRRSFGNANDFHRFEPETDLDKGEIWIHSLPGPALVLGSTQPESLLLPASQRHRDEQQEVTRRRSGGGVVALNPAIDCWIDIFLPISHPRWDPDVGRSFHWVGQAWRRALSDRLLPSDADVQVVGRPERRYKRPLVCFADRGHGEVIVDDRKVVGLSQRRTRSFARIQTLFLARWDPSPITSHIDPVNAANHGFDGPLTSGAGGTDVVAAGLPAYLEVPTAELLIEATVNELVRPAGIE